MVEFVTRVFNGDDGKIIGAEVTVYSSSGDNLGSISIADAETLQEMQDQLEVIDETYFTEERLATILANTNEDSVINATRLSGFLSSDFAKVSQLSDYAPVSHNHTKNQITNLYNYDLKSSSYNVGVGASFTITATVTDQSGNPVVGESITLLCDNESINVSGTTGVNGKFSQSITWNGAGVHKFSIQNKNASCYVNVSGWKDIPLSLSGATLKVNYAQSIAELHYSTSLSSQEVTMEGVIPSQFRPASMYRVIASNNLINLVIGAINTNGDLILKAANSLSAGATMAVSVSFLYKY